MITGASGIKKDIIFIYNVYIYITWNFCTFDVLTLNRNWDYFRMDFAMIITIISF